MVELLFAIVLLLSGVLDELPTSIQRDFYDFDHIGTQMADMQQLAHQEISMAANESDMMGVRSVEHRDWVLQIMYEGKTDNILTIENLKEIEKIEIDILRDPKYKDFCLARSLTDTNCNDDRAFLSFTIIVKGYYRTTSLESITQEMVDDLMDILVRADSWSTYKSFFGVGTDINNTKSKWLRTIFYLGGPLDINGRRYKNMQDDMKEQSDIVADYHREIDERISA